MRRFQRSLASSSLVLGRGFVGEERLEGILDGKLGLLKTIPALHSLCRSFGSSSGENEPLSRDWLARLWVEEKKKKRKENPWLFGGRRKSVVVPIAERGEDAASESWTSLVSSLRKSFQWGTAPVNHPEREVDSGRLRASPVGQQRPRLLVDDSAEEVNLESLLRRANLMITRDIEWANIMFAFEQESRYIIVDASDPGSPVGYIREQSNIIFRQLLRSRRPFTALITDAWGNEIFTVRRPFWWINSTIYAEVDGKEIGVVHRRWHLWRRIYDLYTMNKQFAVVENPGFWNWTFTLKDDHENVLSEITRDWRGIGLELFTDAGQYVIRFGSADLTPTKRASQDDIHQLDVSRPLSLSERAVAVALAVSLDCDYFSRRGGWGLPFIVVGE
ncbi:scramblase-like protein [Wolffia australiana]